MVRILAQYIDLKFYLLFFIFCNAHNFDGSKIASAAMATLVHLAVGSITHNFDEIKISCWFLKEKLHQIVITTVTSNSSRRKEWKNSVVVINKWYAVRPISYNTEVPSDNKHSSH